MNLQHVNVKIFVEGELSVDLERFIQVFHRWVAEQSIPGELLVDVADYRHVPNGPGVVLVGLEADYSLDLTGGRPGLRCNRKGPVEGTNQDRLRQAFAAAANACQRLEAEIEGLKFSRREFEIFINDRALAPNTPNTLAAAKPEVEAFLKEMLGVGDFQLEQDGDGRKLFRVKVGLSRPVEFANLPALGMSR